VNGERKRQGEGEGESESEGLPGTAWREINCLPSFNLVEVFGLGAAFRVEALLV